MLRVVHAAVLVVALASSGQLAGAQTSPTPGPTNPGPSPNPFSKPGSDLVINPTTEECQKGWQPGLKWTKEQFEAYCAEMKLSK